ncbi:hypothetical protein GGER_40300 [Serratia rubidaea]
MALKATIYKATVNIADMDRHFYHDAALTLAQHPSETEQRMMLRLLAWICHADERLTFTKGLSADDEPELWQRNDHNGLELWIELGLPDEKRLKKPATSRRAWCCMPTASAPHRCGGSRCRTRRPATATSACVF